MKPNAPFLVADADREIAALIETLHRSEQRLEQLTGGEVDAVADQDGRMLLLRRAQEHMRHSDAAKRAAVLDALPANIALLDPQGHIVSVNEAWRRFADANALQDAKYAIGVSYLEICARAQGDGAADAQQAGAAIRSVLTGAETGISLEYPGHSPTERRWFLMTVTPLAGEQPHGAIVMHLDITERKRAEEGLRESEARFRALTAMSSDFYWQSDAEHRLNARAAASGKASTVSAFERGATIGKRRWEIPHLSPDEAGWQAHRAVLDAHLPFRGFELSRVGGDGSERHIAVSGDPMFSGSGAFEGYRGVGSDITERKRSEEEISFKNTILNTQQETSLDAILVVNDAGNIISYNHNFIDLWRLPAQLVSARVDAPVLQSVADQVANSDTFVARVRYLNEHREDKSHDEVSLKDGRIIDRYSAPAIGADHRYYGRVWYFRDVTERKQAEQALRSSEDRFKTMFAQAPLGIALIDSLAGHIYEANSRFAEIAGRSIEEMANIDWLKITHPDDVQADLDNMALLNAGKINGFRMEKRYRHPDGTAVWIDMTVAPFKTGDQANPRHLCMIQDITERKAAEHRIAYLNRVYAMLSGINTRIVHARDHDKLFDEACRVAVDQGGFRMSWIGIVDRRAKKIVLAGSAGVGDELLTGLKNLFSSSADTLLGMTLAAQVVRERKVVVINDMSGNPQVVFGRQYAESRIESIAILPLVVSDAVVGVLALYAGERDFFHEEELKLLQELAGNIAFAIENIDRAKKLAKLARVRKVSSGINSAIIRIDKRDALFDEVCRVAVDDGGFRMSLIVTADPHTMKVIPVATAGKDEALISAIKGVLSSTEDARNTMVARSIREKKALVSNDSKNDTQVLFGKLYADADVRSMAVLPLIVADDAIGVLALYAHESGFFDDEEMVLLSEVASDIAFALDHIDKGEKLDYLAYYDDLTGLANRRLFLERLTQYLRFAASGGHKLAVFLIDLERFKNINDSLGRPAGDALLRQVAEWLARNTGDANLLARMGADHFALVLPQLRQDGDVTRLLENTMSAFLEHPFRLNDAVFRISARVGAAVFPDDGADAETLLKNAEAALKKTKASGDRYLFYTQRMTDSVAIKLSLENQLRLALKDQEFVLHYQPKVNLVSGKVTSAEALIRWNDPRTGLVPPGRFIPVLEEIGLIHEVGRWALRQAMEDYLRWRAAGLPAVRIAVNVSALQLRNRGFIEEIRQAIGIGARGAAGLELEITESLIMEDVKGTIANLQAIRELGVRIAIDDFGTGFSSLAYLAKLPVDTLKIDRSFVVGMTAAPEGLALVSTIVNLAHSLKLNVVAEGVETEEQSRLLRLLACDEMQGFLFSKPVPSEVFETRFLAPPAAG